jgi:hypothetical protein
VTVVEREEMKALVREALAEVLPDIIGLTAVAPEPQAGGRVPYRLRVALAVDDLQRKTLKKARRSA